MKIKFKSIANKIYEIDLDASITVTEAKSELAKVIQTDENLLQFIYNAKILSNDKTLDELGYEESKHIIFHVQKPRKESNKLAIPQKPKEEPTIPKPIIPDEPKEKNVPVTPSTTESPQVKYKKETLHSSPLPILEEKQQLRDPPNFEKLVEEITALGFEPADAIKALRAAVYNPNRAAEFLLNNYIPEIPDLYTPAEDTHPEQMNDEEYDDSFDFPDFDEEEDLSKIDYREQLYKAVKSDPSMLPMYLQDLALQNPSLAPLINTDPAAFLVSLGMNPQDFDLTGIAKKTEYETLMEKFTQEEKEAIHRLEKRGFDTMTVLQVFDACGRDEELTASCLSDMS